MLWTEIMRSSTVHVNKCVSTFARIVLYGPKICVHAHSTYDFNNYTKCGMERTWTFKHRTYVFNIYTKCGMERKLTFKHRTYVFNIYTNRVICVEAHCTYVFNINTKGGTCIWTENERSSTAHMLLEQCASTHITCICFQH